jgi:hypothetical protein
MLSDMPVDVAKLREAHRPLEERILGFLRMHSLQGYTSAELLNEVVGYDWTADRMLLALMNPSERTLLDEHERALEELVKRGDVERVPYHGQSYYLLARRG